MKNADLILALYEIVKLLTFFFYYPQHDCMYNEWDFSIIITLNMATFVKSCLLFPDFSISDCPVPDYGRNDNKNMYDVVYDMCLCAHENMCL